MLAMALVHSIATGPTCSVPPAVHCGAWCEGAPHGATCLMDEAVVACTGSWCSTTCVRWIADVLRVGDTLVDCDAFAGGLAYPRGAVPCADGCLPQEVGIERYPMPTGHGLLCAPGTCEPAVQSRYAQGGAARGLGVLSCPCNWFGADCITDARRVLGLKSRRTVGTYQLLTITVSREDWWDIVADHKPGAVVRLQANRSRTGRSALPGCVGGAGTGFEGGVEGTTTSWAGERPLEQPLALATRIPWPRPRSPAAVGELDLMTGPPDAGMHPQTTELLLRLRAMPVGPVPPSGDGALSVNPAVGGFFSRKGSTLLDALDASPKMKHVVLVATGTGLAAMLPTIELLVRRNRLSQKEEDTDELRVHLHYGIRSLRHLPYATELARWAASGALQLTISLSAAPGEAERLEAAHGAEAAPSILAGVARGDALARAVAALQVGSSAEEGSSSGAGHGSRLLLRRMLAESAKLYVHHALAADLALSLDSEAGAVGRSLADDGVVVGEVVVAVCGRSQILGGAERALLAACAAAGGHGSSAGAGRDACGAVVAQRLFVNI